MPKVLSRLFLLQDFLVEGNVYLHGPLTTRSRQRFEAFAHAACSLPMHYCIANQTGCQTDGRTWADIIYVYMDSASLKR